LHPKTATAKIITSHEIQAGHPVKKEPSCKEGSFTSAYCPSLLAKAQAKSIGFSMLSPAA